MRNWQELMGRDNGPLQFRFMLQPLVAALLAIRTGRRDARDGRPPFLTAFVREPRTRWRPVVLESWKDIGRLFLLCILLDVIYLLIVVHGIRPGQSLIVATVLAVVPYLVVRGLTNRIMTWLCREGPATIETGKSRFPENSDVVIANPATSGTAVSEVDGTNKNCHPKTGKDVA